VHEKYPALPIVAGTRENKKGSYWMGFISSVGLARSSSLGLAATVGASKSARIRTIEARREVKETDFKI
jgi:hypothetical protein